MLFLHKIVTRCHSSFCTERSIWKLICEELLSMEHATRTFTARSHDYSVFIGRNHLLTYFQDMLTRADSPVVSKVFPFIYVWYVHINYRDRELIHLILSVQLLQQFAKRLWLNWYIENNIMKMDQMDREMQTRHVAITISQDGTILVHGSPSCGHLMTVCNCDVNS